MTGCGSFIRAEASLKERVHAKTAKRKDAKRGDPRGTQRNAEEHIGRYRTYRTYMTYRTYTARPGNDRPIKRYELIRLPRSLIESAIPACTNCRAIGRLKKSCGKPSSIRLASFNCFK